jgi:putative membrane protein
MSAPNGATNASRFDVRVTADSHFAWIRTRFSVERTMMSMMRTAVSLIGFGFAIVQFFERLQQAPVARPVMLPDAPKYLGLSLIACGVLTLLVSIWQYWWTVRYLWLDAYAPLAGMTKDGLQSPAIGIAVLLVLVGLFAIGAVILHVV